MSFTFRSLERSYLQGGESHGHRTFISLLERLTDQPYTIFREQAFGCLDNALLDPTIAILDDVGGACTEKGG